ncbi:MAG: TetR family transcriptional regulator [Propionibacteriaceae bacterium]|nr:TetR family transcriptional regulator [Propionibacteriaceae bacterium]
MSITHDDIVTTGLDLLDSYGFGDLTMRRIASTLGVQPSALYWHVASKQDLLRAMADVIITDLPPFPGGDLSRIPPWAARFHSLLTRYRHGSELVWSVLTTHTWADGLGSQIETGLIDAGIPPHQALAASRGLLHVILGHGFDDDNRQESKRLGLASSTWPNSSATFDEIIAIFLKGLTS